MNSNEKQIKELQQTICNVVNYVLWLYEKKFVSERTKDELLKICNTGKSYEPRKKK